MVWIVAFEINLPFSAQAVPQAGQVSKVRQDFGARHRAEPQRLQGGRHREYNCFRLSDG